MNEKAPIILGAVFIGVTISRIASFAGGNVTAWAIAIVLALGVYWAAYNIDNNGKINKKALTLLIFLTFIDCFFNFSDTIKWSVESGRWNFAMQYGETKLYIYRIADLLLGIFPTITAAGLAWVARSIEKKHRKSVGIKAQLQEGFALWMLQMLPEPAQAKQSESMSVPVEQISIAEQKHDAFLCEGCEKEFGTVQALSAHKRFCENKISVNGHNK